MYGHQAPPPASRPTALPAQPAHPPRAPREAWDRPTRIESVPGTPFGLVYFGSPPVVAGPAIGSLVAGVGGIVVAFIVACVGLAGAADGWGAWVAGAFAVLAGFLGGSGVGLGVAGLRRTRRRLRLPFEADPERGSPERGSPERGGIGGAVGGRGFAVAGLVCGAVAVAITLSALGLSLLVTITT